MNKSVKEGKEHSSWITPNEAYEAAVATFVERVLAGPEAAKFLPAFQPFQRSRGAVRADQLAVAGGAEDRVSGRAGLLPGLRAVGSVNLVDPDNRRPVDFDGRRQALDRVDALLAQPAAERRAGIAALLDHWKDGEIKLLVTAAGLRLRAAEPALFLEGEYLPLEVESTVDARARRVRAAIGRRPRRDCDRPAPGLTPDHGGASRPARRSLAHLARPPAQIAGRTHLPRRLHRRRNPPGDRRRERLAVCRPGVATLPVALLGGFRVVVRRQASELHRLRARTTNSLPPSRAGLLLFAIQFHDIHRLLGGAEQVAAEVVGAALIHVRGLARVADAGCRAGS